MDYRNLYASEIATLESRQCKCDNWSDVRVSSDFNPLAYTNVSFSGQIKLGSTDSTFSHEGGISRYAGISNATLHNVDIADGVYINSVANYIANYNIEAGAYIENVNRIIATGDSTFGVGTEVSVLNETGGREVPIYERLSAQTAYMLAMYRHNPKLTKRLQDMVKIHAESKRTERGTIGANASIINTGVIKNVNIGAFSRIEGATRLTNGTITGSETDPVFVGANVIATDFILASGANIQDGVVLLHSFVGQASHLTHLFSAHDSLFFANCTCENGEACAIFAGPYTVTMHKSSLLIAGMFSFLNAGSGSNQSNHMYKLGPIHQGVVERGSKTTSDSYILWPAKIGAFSLVMGRHVSHPDTSRLPFSYLIESHSRTYLVPGVNLKSVGTIRDAQKWPKRDKRRDPDKLDQINFNLLSPYTISKMMGGIQLLNCIEQTSGLTADRYSYQNTTIEARALRKGRDYYNMAIDKFMGNSVIKRLEGINFSSPQQIIDRMKPDPNIPGTGEWLDICGLIAPKSEISNLIRDIIEEKVSSLDAIEERFRILHANYYDMEWSWVAENFCKWWGKTIDQVTPQDIIDIVNRWKKQVITLDRMLYDDAQKEYSLMSKTGFGVDGTEARQESDFEHVRGTFESDPFVKMVLDHIDAKSRLGDELIDRVTPLL